jgi:hypothetical protein
MIWADLTRLSIVENSGVALAMVSLPLPAFFGAPVQLISAPGP